VRFQGDVGQSPGRGDSAKDLWRTGPPGPPRRRPWGDAEPEGPEGQTAVGHEGIGRRAPTTAEAQSVPTLAAAARPLPGERMRRGAPRGWAKPPGLRGVGTSTSRGCYIGVKTATIYFMGPLFCRNEANATSRTAT
jgi:hypothetical protein